MHIQTVLTDYICHDFMGNGHRAEWLAGWLLHENLDLCLRRETGNDGLV